MRMGINKERRDPDSLGKKKIRNRIGKTQSPESNTSHSNNIPLTELIATTYRSQRP